MNIKQISTILMLPQVILLLSSTNTYPSDGEISGVLTDGITHLRGARVRVKATPIFALTNSTGRFTLKGIASSDTLVVTAWAEGYYNGETHAVAGDTDVVISLHPLPAEDNQNYQWRSPEPDSAEELRCSNCHPEVFISQWRNNAHGKSAINPFFMAMYYGTDIDGGPEVGVGYKRDFKHTQGSCATCHIPGAAANNPWGVDPKEVTGASRHGVFCDFCHKIYRVKPSTGQGTTGVLSIELLRPPEDEQIFFGPFDDIGKPDSYSPLIRKSEFCSPCHTGQFWGTPAYNSFPEWQASPYPQMGIECQTCHMAPDGVTTNFAPGHGGVERNPLSIPSHLQPGSRDPQILANAVTMTLSTEQHRDTLKVTVTVLNDQTGHHVPAGRPSRNMILLVEAADNTSAPLEFIDGETVPWWGGVGDISNGDYADMPGKGFAKILEDFEGNAPAPSWRPSRILSDNRIAAFEADTSYYYYRIPSEIDTILISSKLLYRRFFKQWMNEKKFDISDITMENESIEWATLPSGTPDEVIQRSDFNGNGKVDFSDFILFAQQYDRQQADSNFDATFDLNGNGSVDFEDFLQIAQNFGKKVSARKPAKLDEYKSF